MAFYTGKIKLAQKRRQHLILALQVMLVRQYPKESMFQSQLCDITTSFVFRSAIFYQQHLSSSVRQSMQGPGTRCASSSIQGRTVPLCSELSLTGSNRDCRAGLPTTSPVAGIDAAIIQYRVQLRTALGITTSMGCRAPHLYFIITVEDYKETAWTALLKSMAPQFMSQLRYKTDSFTIS